MAGMEKRDYHSDELFQQIVALHGTRIAVTDAQESITYRTLAERVDRISRYLAARPDWVSGTPVALMTDKTCDSVALLLAITRAGGVFVPIAPENPLRRVEKILSQCDCRLLIADRSMQEKLASEESGRSNRYTVLFLETIRTSPPAKVTLPAPSPVAYILFTSGTTGEPKGIGVSNRSFVHAAIVNYQRFFDEEDRSYESIRQDPIARRIALNSYFSFDPSIIQIFSALLFGHTLIVIPERVKRDPLLLEQYLCEKQVQILDITPTHLNLYLRFFADRAFYLPEWIVSIGEPLTHAFVHALFRAGVYGVINAYGPTEATVYSHGKRMREEEANGYALCSIGRFLPGYTGYLLDANGNEVPAGEEGELYIASDYLAEGYVGRPDLTAEAFLPNPFTGRGRMYKTGDICVQKGEEYICLGRKDQQIKISGHRIEPQEIEQILQGELGLKDARVLTVQEQGKTSLCAFHCETDRSEEEIKAELRKRVPSYMVPGQVIGLSELPLNINGKLDRKSLLAIRQKNRISPQAERKEKGAHTVEEQILLEALMDLFQKEMETDTAFPEQGLSSLEVFMVNTVLYRNWNRTVDGVKLSQCKNARDILHLLQEDGAGRKCRVDETGNTAVAATPFQQQLIKKEKKERAYRIKTGCTKKRIPPYNVVHRVRVSHPLQADKLRNAVEQIGKRHRVLQACFYWDGKILQFGSAEGQPGLFQYRKEETQANFHPEDWLQEFDPMRLPLFQVLCIEYQDGSQELFVNFHHTVSDALSVYHFVDELLLLHEGKTLQPLPMDYFTFAKELPAYKDRAASFWRKEMQNRPRASAPMRTGRSGKNRADTGFHLLQFAGDQALLAACRSFCSQHAISLYTFFLGTLLSLLQNKTGEEDLVIGSFFHGRPLAMPGSALLIGQCVQMLPVRFQMKEENEAAFFRRLQNKTEAILANQGVDMNDIYTMQEPEDKWKGEYFHVLYNHHTIKTRAVAGTGLSYMSEDIAFRDREDVPFYLQIAEKEDRFTCYFHLSEAVYSKEEAEDLRDGFRQSIQSWIQEPVSIS